MEKEKKTTKKPVTNAKKQVKAAPKRETKTAVVRPSSRVSKSIKTTVKAEKVPAVEEVKVVETKKTETNQPVKRVTLNQELNLLIGLFSLITIISFCFAFQNGNSEVLGWELFLRAGDYSGVFQGLMIIYVISIFIDCILTIRLDTDNEIVNLIEKALYMFTVIMNFIVVAVLLSLISKIGIGLIIFFIISILSAIVKFARIFAQK